MFDQDPRGKAFIFKESSEKIKVLTRHRISNTLEAFYCNMFLFRRVANEYYSWFEQQEKILDSKNA